MELIERRANLILLQGERILDAIQRVGPEMNRYRTVQPGESYTPPPLQSKLDPTDITEIRLRQLLAEAQAGRPIWRALVSGIAGISPLFAREVVFRATGDSQTPISECDRISPLLNAFLDALTPYWEHEWQPGAILGPDGRVVAFAPYQLTHLGRPEPAESISVAAGRYYRPLLGTTPYLAAKIPLQGAIQSARRRLVRKRNSLARQAPDPDALQTLRQKGELILAYSPTINPQQTEMQAQYDPEGSPLLIALDPKLSPVANWK